MLAFSTRATTSLWRDTASLPEFPALDGDLDADVAVIGGGITGVTAAYLLSRAGQRVVLLERARVGQGETGQTTAHVTQVFDTRFKDLTTRFGTDAARLAAQSHREAVDFIDTLADRCGLANDVTSVPAYLYSEAQDDRDALAEEADAARRLGISCAYTTSVPLPFRVAGAVRFDEQRRLHPLRYLRSVLGLATDAGTRTFEQTPVMEVVDGQPCSVNTTGGVVRARAVFVATNVPINNRVLIQTKLTASRSYAIAVRLESPPPDALFWDTANPYHYLRLQPAERSPLLIVGGRDHRVGMEGGDGAFDALEEYTLRHFGDVRGIRHRWSGQIIEPVDGLPYIGRNAFESHVFIATGYSGTGLTLGTLAAQMVSDAVLGRDHPCRDLYEATRIPVTSVVEYVKENVVFPIELVKDRIAGGEREKMPASFDSIEPGEGVVINAHSLALAASRDLHGALHVVKATCTHLGCDVRWNRAEQSWDCPCHGSRFSPEGHVLNGPAVKNLEPAPVSAVAARAG
jgi:glycine/D-amino acid oxidase-like deaminating enzyme/nitrite reductase/ring-hydroxylating ferredoxin subunit